MCTEGRTAPATASRERTTGKRGNDAAVQPARKTYDKSATLERRGKPEECPVQDCAGSGGEIGNAQAWLRSNAGHIAAPPIASGPARDFKHVPGRTRSDRRKCHTAPPDLDHAAAGNELLVSIPSKEQLVASDR